MKSFKQYCEVSRLLQEDHKHLLPTSGQLPYVPPKNSHGHPKRVEGSGKEVYADIKGKHWQFDLSHDPHWDLSSPRDKARNSYIRVGPDGRIWEVAGPTVDAKLELLLEYDVDTLTATHLLLE